MGTLLIDKLLQTVVTQKASDLSMAPQEARDGKSIAAYRNYFRLAHQWTRPGAYFGLQTILRNFVPRDRQDVKDVGWVTYEIFPGGITPRLEEIIAMTCLPEADARPGCSWLLWLDLWALSPRNPGVAVQFAGASWMLP